MKKTSFLGFVIDGTHQFKAPRQKVGKEKRKIKGNLFPVARSEEQQWGPQTSILWASFPTHQVVIIMKMMIFMFSPQYNYAFIETS